mmetsp:Transcript_72323/g.162327  ORF Transcript_72323/g.162327 Transcript_72323/m.162327 type:complete len:576 (-) Transcript_72323:14-1741(-)
MSPVDMQEQELHLQPQPLKPAQTQAAAEAVELQERPPPNEQQENQLPQQQVMQQQQQQLMEPQMMQQQQLIAQQLLAEQQQSQLLQQHLLQQPLLQQQMLLQQQQQQMLQMQPMQRQQVAQDVYTGQAHEVDVGVPLPALAAQVGPEGLVAAAMPASTAPATEEGQQLPAAPPPAPPPVPPLSVASLTRPPPGLPPQLQVEFEAEAETNGAGVALGEGAFAAVRRFRHRRSGEWVALKVLEKYPLVIREMLPQLQREVRIQGGLQHRHIVRLLSSFEDECYVYMLLEYCSGGSLRGLCASLPGNRLPEAQAAIYFAQIVQGVAFMHQNAYVHRDLKPDNILLSAPNGEVRICDFGWSAEVQVERALRTTCGTPNYWPPEIFEGLPQSFAVDIWALGNLVYELLVGHAPFWGSTEELRWKVLTVDLRYPPGLLSSEAVHLFHCLLQRDPAVRAPAHWLLAEHPWVRGGIVLADTPPVAEPSAGDVASAGAVVASEIVASASPAAEEAVAQVQEMLGGEAEAASLAPGTVPSVAREGVALTEKASVGEVEEAVAGETSAALAVVEGASEGIEGAGAR